MDTINQSSQKLKVICWNVRNLGLLWRQGRRGGGVDFEQRAVIIGKLLYENLPKLDSFLVILLEAGKNANEIGGIIAAKLPAGGKWYSRMSGTKDGESFIIFYKLNQYASQLFNSLQDQDLVIENPLQGKRGVIKIMFGGKRMSGDSLMFIGCHAPSASSMKKEIDRAKYVSSAAAFRNGSECILLGDLNITDYKTLQDQMNPSPVSMYLAGPSMTFCGMTIPSGTSLRTNWTILKQDIVNSQNIYANATRTFSAFSYICNPFDQVWATSEIKKRMFEIEIGYSFTKVISDENIAGILDLVLERITGMINGSESLDIEAISALDDFYTLCKKLDGNLIDRDVVGKATEVYNFSSKNISHSTKVTNLVQFKKSYGTINGILSSYSTGGLWQRAFFAYEYAISDHLPLLFDISLS